MTKEKYPRGKLNAEDEGVLNISIRTQDKTVIIDFGKDVTWIGMSKDEAFDFAKRIMMHCVDRYVKLETKGEEDD